MRDIFDLTATTSLDALRLSYLPQNNTDRLFISENIKEYEKSNKYQLMSGVDYIILTDTGEMGFLLATHGADLMSLIGEQESCVLVAEYS